MPPPCASVQVLVKGKLFAPQQGLLWPLKAAQNLLGLAPPPHPAKVKLVCGVFRVKLSRATLAPLGLAPSPLPALSGI
eukprot:501110-Pyramimonas_sp.AAC.1